MDAEELFETILKIRNKIFHLDEREAKRHTRYPGNDEHSVVYTIP